MLLEPLNRLTHTVSIFYDVTLSSARLFFVNNNCQSFENDEEGLQREQLQGFHNRLILLNII